MPQGHVRTTRAAHTPPHPGCRPEGDEDAPRWERSSGRWASASTTAPPPASGLRAAPLPTGLGMAERRLRPVATQRARLACVRTCSGARASTL